jgi:hypothetical protein
MKGDIIMKSEKAQWILLYTILSVIAVLTVLDALGVTIVIHP